MLVDYLPIIGVYSGFDTIQILISVVLVVLVLILLTFWRKN